jgi:hypothetical protein
VVADAQESDTPVPVLVKSSERKIRATRKSRKREDAAEQAVDPAGQVQAACSRLGASKQKPGAADNDTKVVHLDAFRKK